MSRSALMASNVLAVILEGRPIGEIERSARGELRLRYDEGYSSNMSATPLSVSMPPTRHVYDDVRVTPCAVERAKSNG